MKINLLAAAVLAAAGLCVSCRTADAELKTGPGAEELYRAEVVAKGERMLQAFRDDRPGAFTAELSGDAAEKFTAKEFTASRAVLTENLGEITRTEFLDRLASPVFETYLWKVAFVREKSDGEKLLQETLFRLVVAQGKDKAPVILSFGFL